MSLNFTQITSLIDRNCKSNSVSYPISEKTEDANLELSLALHDIFASAGKWQYDDVNHTDYPIITTNLNAGQRDYTFVSDESGNLILDIYKVMVKDQNGYYYEVYPVDMQSDYGTESFYDGRNTQGQPNRYDKTANGIFLDAIPSYSQTDGLKIFINRESSYFTTSDTTKKPGFAGTYHERIPLGCSIRYCKRNKMFDLSDRYEKDYEKIKLSMKQHYRDRSRDEQTIITGQSINSI